MTSLSGYLASTLRVAEGVRKLPYTDTTGNLTIGVGHNLSRGISEAAIEFILTEDIIEVLGQCEQFTFWKRLNLPRQAAIAELCFNLGWKKLNTFVTFLRMVTDGQYLEAAVDLRQTLWATQVGRLRANRIATMIHTGTFPSIPKVTT